MAWVYFRKTTAQAASEYALALALVALVGIGGLAVFGPSLLNSLGWMGASVAGTGTIATKAPTGGGPLPTSTTAGTSTLAITLSDGSTIAVPNYPTNQAQLVDTAGTNGATDLYIAALRDLVDQLVLSGELTPEQAGYLTDLANAGHELAQEEKLLEEYCFNSIPAPDGAYGGTGMVGACNVSGLMASDLAPAIRSGVAFRMNYANGGFPDVYIMSDLTGRYNYLDRFMSATSFDSSLGAVNNSGIAAARLVLDDPNATSLEKLQAIQEQVYPAGFSYSATSSSGYSSPPIVGVYNQYRQALDNGSLDNPAVKTVVSTLVNEILNMQTRLGDALGEINRGDPDLTTAKQTKVSGPTHGKSSNICTTGMGQSTGVHCNS